MNPVASKFLLDLVLWGASGLLAYAFRKPGLVMLGIPVNVWGYVLLSMIVMDRQWPWIDWRRITEQWVYDRLDDIEAHVANCVGEDRLWSPYGPAEGQHLNDAQG